MPLVLALKVETFTRLRPSQGSACRPCDISYVMASEQCRDILILLWIGR